MKLASIVTDYLTKHTYIREEELLELLKTHASAFAPAILEDMLTSGFLSAISVDDRTIYVLGTKRVSIHRDGVRPATMGF